MSATEEAAYRALLRLPWSDATAVAAALASDAAAVEAVLLSLESRGLVSSSRDAVRKWSATTPEVAVELLLMERQVELNRARTVLPDLLRGLMHETGAADNQDVQVVPADSGAQLAVYLELQHAAREVIASVICPPFVAAAPDAMEAARAQARRRGVKFRTLMAPETLAWPGWREAVQQELEAGDEVRIADQLPFKMLLCDHSFGLLPLRKDMPDGPALRLGHTTALDALWLMFETLWERATPALEASVDEAAEAPTGPADADTAELNRLVTLLASGANDKKIADVLGISERTLMRRISALSTHLQARSRFHCGWLAARRFGSAD